MHISSWKKIYKSMENQEFQAFIITPIFDINLGIIKFYQEIDYMDDLIIIVKDLNNNEIFRFNTLDAAAIEESKKPFFQGVFIDEIVPIAYYRIKFPKVGMSLYFKKK